MAGPRRHADDQRLSEPAAALAARLLPRCAFPSPPTSVTCAVSGGSDSLALLVLATCAGLTVTAVHVDHGLRPGSAAEAAVVRAAADRLGASFRAERVAVVDGPNLEARARNARRAVLPAGALTGHTADDRAETLLLNLLRGAGPAGLAAPAPGPTRPIVALRRAECRELVACCGLEVVADPSNDDPRFRRNRVRHELLPLLEDIADRDVVPLLVRTADLLDGLDRFVADQASALDPTDAGALRSVPEPVAAAALRSWLRTLNADRHPPDAATIARVLDVVWLRRRATELPGGRRLARRAGILHVE